MLATSSQGDVARMLRGNWSGGTPAANSDASGSELIQPVAPRFGAAVLICPSCRLSRTNPAIIITLSRPQPSCMVQHCSLMDRNNSRPIVSTKRRSIYAVVLQLRITTATTTNVKIMVTPSQKSCGGTLHKLRLKTRV